MQTDGSLVTGSGTIRISSGTVAVGGGYSVAGTTQISGGNLVCNANASSAQTILSSGALGGSATFTGTANFSWTGGAMNGSGTTAIAPAATLTISGGANVEVRTLSNAGTAIWNGTGDLFLSTGAVINNSGSFTVQNDQRFAYNGGAAPSIINSGTFTKAGTTGTTSTTGAVLTTNSGLIDLQTGILSVSGNYTPASSAVLAVKIGGTTAGSQFTRLAVANTASLAGGLQVSLAGGYVPNIGDSFRIITAGTRTGTFGSVSGLDIGNGRLLALSYDATGVSAVVVQATPTATPVPAICPTATITPTPTPSATATPTPR